MVQDHRHSFLFPLMHQWKPVFIALNLEHSSLKMVFQSRLNSSSPLTPQQSSNTQNGFSSSKTMISPTFTTANSISTVFAVKKVSPPFEAFKPSKSNSQQS